MEILLYVQMLLIIIGIILAQIGYDRRLLDRPFAGSQYRLWVWSREYRKCFPSAGPHRLFALGVSIILVGGLIGSIRWLPQTWFN